MVRNDNDGMKLSKLNIIPDNEATTKFEICQYLKKYESTSPNGANFMLLDPNHKIYYTVPVADIDFVMHNLMICHSKQMMNYMYEFPDICRTSDGKNEPMSGLFFEFKFESGNKKAIPFEKVVSRFIRVLFKDIVQECLAIPKEKITHHCLFLASTPVYDMRTQLYVSKFRIIVPTIMTTPKTRFGIYHRLCNIKYLRTLFKDEFGIYFRDCFQRSMRLAPIPLIGSCENELGILLQHDGQIISVDVDGTKEELSRANDKMVHNMTDGDAYTATAGKLIDNIIYAASINYQPANCMIVKRPYYATPMFDKKIDDYISSDKKHAYQEEYDKARAKFITEMANNIVNRDHQRITYTQMYDWLKMLNAERFATLDNWQEVLRCLAFNGDYYYCVAVIITRERAKQFADLDLLAEYWSDSKSPKYKNKYTPSAIKHWANCDASQRVANYTGDLIRDKMIEDIVAPFINGKLEHENFANYLEIMLKNEFITVDGDSKSGPVWYEFVTNRSTDVKKGQMYKWRVVGSEPDRLIKCISNDLVKLAENVHWELRHAYQYYSNESTKDEFRAKAVAKIIKRFSEQNGSLYKFPFKQAIVKSSVYKFKNNTFMEHLDKVENILGVGNGVLEFQGADVIFIDHYHNYPVSLYTDTNYIPYDPDNEYIITMMKVLKSLVPEGEEDALDFLLYYFSTSLDWLPKEALFFIIHGVGANGKSVIMDLFNRTMGNSYAKKLPLSFITDLTTEKSGAANPTIMDLEYARMATYSESNKNEKVNIAKIKEVTGGELISGRALFKDQKNFRVNCNHIVTTNHCFSLQTTEHAVWRRFISYKFKIRFVPSDPVPGTNDRLGDRILIEKIKADKKYHEAFLSILVHYRSMLHRKYKGNILHVPHPTIRRETEEYRLSQDIYEKYIMQNLYYSKNVEPQPLHVLASNFRAFCSVELSTTVHENTDYIIATFKNSIALQKHIVDHGGILLLQNVYSLEAHAPLAPNSMLFSEWLKQEDCE